jgi:hypothetical protein
MRQSWLLLVLAGLLAVAVCRVPVVSGGPRPGFQILHGQPVWGESFGGKSSRILVRPIPADPATFKVVPPPPKAVPDAYTYARDARAVFFGADTKAYELPDCDPATFAILSTDGKYVRDASHVYYCGILLRGANPETFWILPSPYSKDDDHVYAGAAVIDDVDPTTFEVIRSGYCEAPFIWGYGPTFEPRDDPRPKTDIRGWARDKNACFFGDRRVHAADRDTFEALGDAHAKDKNHVYYGEERRVSVIVGADPGSFRVDPNQLLGGFFEAGSDKNGIYRRGERTP